MTFRTWIWSFLLAAAMFAAPMRDAQAEQWFPVIDRLLSGGGLDAPWVNPAGIAADVNRMASDLAPAVTSTATQLVQSSATIVGEVTGQLVGSTAGGQTGRVIADVCSGAENAANTAVEAVGATIGHALGGDIGGAMGGSVASSLAAGENPVDALVEQSPRIAGGLIGAATGGSLGGPAGAIVGREIVKSTMCTMDGPAAPAKDAPPEF